MAPGRLRYSRVLAGGDSAGVLGGTQVTLLSEHTQTYWAWTIALPISAIFIGASFCATSVLFAWGLQQREWIRVRAVVSGGPFVTVGLLVATLRHIGEFHGAVGVIWVEAYVFAVPAFLAAAVQQLMVPLCRLRRYANQGVSVVAPVRWRRVVRSA